MFDHDLFNFKFTSVVWLCDNIFMFFVPNFISLHVGWELSDFVFTSPWSLKKSVFRLQALTQNFDLTQSLIHVTY